MARLQWVRSLAETVLWVLAFIASYIVAQYIVSFAVQLLLWLGVRWEVQGVVSLLSIRVVVYGVIGVLLGGLLWLRVRRRVTLGDFGLSRLVQWKDIGLSMAGAVIYVLGTIALAYVATLFFKLDTAQVQDLGISTRLFGGELLAAFVVLVVLTPLLEEALFRGFLYGRLRSATKMSWWLPAIVVSVLFGIAHGQWNVGLDVFVLSMVACYLREITGSIWGGIVLHMAKNMVAFMAMFVFAGSIGG